MWKVVIKQEYEYSFQDGTKSTGTHDSEYLFNCFEKAMSFIECAIKNATSKTWAQIEYVEGEAHE